MSTGRAYQKDDTVYRVRLEWAGGSVKLLGPYGTVGAARGQRTSWMTSPYGNRPVSADIEKSSSTWELVPDE